MDKELPEGYKFFSSDFEEANIFMKMEGYKSISFSELMKLRINHCDRFPVLKEFFHTTDAFIAGRQGDYKINRDSNHLRKLHRERNPAYGGYVTLKDSEFESLSGKDILYLPKKKVEKINNMKYNENSIKDSEVWNFLANGDSKLLAEYAKIFFPEMKKKFGLIKGMKIKFDSLEEFRGNKDVLVPCHFDKLEEGFNVGMHYTLGYGGTLTSLLAKKTNIPRVRFNLDKLVEFGKEFIPVILLEKYKEGLMDMGIKDNKSWIDFDLEKFMGFNNQFIPDSLMRKYKKDFEWDFF